MSCHESATMDVRDRWGIIRSNEEICASRQNNCYCCSSGGRYSFVFFVQLNSYLDRLGSFLWLFQKIQLQVVFKFNYRLSNRGLYWSSRRYNKSVREAFLDLSELTAHCRAFPTWREPSRDVNFSSPISKLDWKPVKTCRWGLISWGR